jgi:hypothetical protein
MLGTACYVTYTLLGEWINSVLWYRNPACFTVGYGIKLYEKVQSLGQ